MPRHRRDPAIRRRLASRTARSRGRPLAGLPHPAEDGSRELFAPTAGGERCVSTCPSSRSTRRPRHRRQVRGPQWSRRVDRGDRVAPDGTARRFGCGADISEAPEPVVEEVTEASDVTAGADGTDETQWLSCQRRNRAGDADDGRARWSGRRRPLPHRNLPAPSVAWLTAVDRRPDALASLVARWRRGCRRRHARRRRPGGECPAGLTDAAHCRADHGRGAGRRDIWSRDGRFIAWTQQHGDDRRYADICTEPSTGEVKNLNAEKE